MVNENLERSDKTETLKALVTKLNHYRDLYYNHNQSEISDYDYDTLYDELVRTEKETGIILSNSPTQTVGYEVISQFDKVKHEYPLLSLDKTKEISELKKFVNSGNCFLMHKLDGLTCCLTYDNGVLVRAETRGNGTVGEDITNNARTFNGVPLRIPYKGHLVVAGEAVIPIWRFEEINAMLPKEQQYKNPRNLAAGTVRQLDSNICASRGVRFIVWDVLSELNGDNSLVSKLVTVAGFGFSMVDGTQVTSNSVLESAATNLKSLAEFKRIPIDGLVLKYDDIAFGNSLGRTGHHFKNGIAYKFYDEEVTTTLTDIEFSMGRTGVLTPIAVFDTVNIDGTEVCRASLHNLSIVKSLQLGIGDEIAVYKANAIIPQISENFTRSDTFKPLEYCPVCGSKTEIVQDNNSKILICPNKNCKEKIISQLVYFVSKPCFDIDGLSEATIRKLVGLKWVNTCADIFNLSEYKSDMMNLEGFGETSVNKLLANIESSKKVKFENFITALGIPLVGKSAAILLVAKYSTIDELKKCTIEELNSIDGVGMETATSIIQYLSCNESSVDTLVELCDIQYPVHSSSSAVFNSMTFVITGALNHFSNRDKAVEYIQDRGGKVVGSVSGNTTYLINNDIESNSSKNKKAKALGVSIITEEQLLEIGG